MINCGSAFPAYPSFVYPTPQSTTQAGSRPAIFLLACCCCCRRRLLRAGWGEGWAAGGRSYLTIHGRATLSVWGEPGSRSSSERAAGSVSGYHFRNPGRQAVPPCPAAASSRSLSPPPHSCPHPTTSSPHTAFPREAKMAAGADAPAGPGLGLERSPFRPPSGRGERACAVRCAAGCRSHSEGEAVHFGCSPGRGGEVCPSLQFSF